MLNQYEPTILKTWKVRSKDKIYTIKIRFDLKNKLICWMDCDCADFTGCTDKDTYFRSHRIKEFGQFADTKYYAEPCKHLKPYIDYYLSQGFKLKEYKMEGLEHPNAELKRFLQERSGGICERCHENKGVHVHRIIRGSNGGKYNKENCVLLCEECHQLAHGNEFGGVKSK